MKFYDRYAQLCAERKIDPCSQATANMLGISKSTISSWGSKNTFPKGDNVAVIADAFGVSADYLLGRTDDPTDYANGDVIASLAGPVLDHFDGDVKKAAAAQRAIAEDAMRERQSMPDFYKQYLLLDEIDRAKAEAFVSGLLAADKYQVRQKNA